MSKGFTKKKTACSNYCKGLVLKFIEIIKSVHELLFMKGKGQGLEPF